MAENKSVFQTLNAINVENKIKEKGGLTYLPWASAWAEVKKVYPDATFTIYEQIIDEHGNTRPWHTDSNSGWVKVGVTINGSEIIEILPIMDFKNKNVPLDKITSVEANKSIKRCFVKACAHHGLGLYIYEGEDLPEEISKTQELQEEIKTLAFKKVKLSDKAKEKVEQLCKEAQKKANPELSDDLISGDYTLIDDVEILTDLYKKLLAVKK